MTPIEAAVAPQKEEAVRRSVEFMRKRVDEVVEKGLGKDINVVAPRPLSTMSTEAYRSHDAQRKLYIMLLNTDGNSARKPMIATSVNEEGVARFLEEARLMAEAQFDAYVAKLESRVGQCDSAELSGHLWQSSCLTVTKGERVERWKTQQILNVSKYGKLFNQWPTRMMGPADIKLLREKDAQAQQDSPSPD